MTMPATNETHVEHPKNIDIENMCIAVAIVFDSVVIVKACVVHTKCRTELFFSFVFCFVTSHSSSHFFSPKSVDHRHSTGVNILKHPSIHKSEVKLFFTTHYTTPPTIPNLSKQPQVFHYLRDILKNKFKKIVYTFITKNGFHNITNH